MSSEEFSLHLAYWATEPAGPEGLVHLWAALMAAVANGPMVKRDKSLFFGTDFWDGKAWAPPPKRPKQDSSTGDLKAMLGHMKTKRVAKARRG